MISVIVPVFNGENTIGKCLECLLKQTRKPDEIIVVDDGSADKTKEMIKKFKNIILLEQKHGGPASARNLGAMKAMGDIILFTDADCNPSENWVFEMVKPFRDETIAGVQGRYKTNQKGLMAKFVQFEIEDRYDRMRKREHIDFIGSYSAGYRKNVFMQYGGFDESFSMASGEDPDISFKLSKAGHKMIFSENAVVYHNHVDSLGAYLKQKFWRAYWRILLYKKHPGKIAGESYTPQMIKFQIFILATAFLLAVASVFSVQFVLPFAGAAVLLFISTLPLSFKNFKKSIPTGIATPFISILRTIIFAFGLAYGVLRL